MTVFLLSSQKINFLFSSLLFLTFFAIPFQLGKHLWPSFAYVNGTRVDYLSPTLYISDILIVLLSLITLSMSFLQKQESRFRIKSGMTNKNLLVFVGGILYLSVGVFFSQSPFNGWYSLLKLIELMLFAYIVGKEVAQKKVLLFWALGSGVVVEGVLALLQFLNQRSLGGFWYFLGERTFSSTTPGIANASIQGQLILRPYATFSHPNVLAGYLVIALLFLLTWVFTTKNFFQKVLSMLLVVFGFGILILTLSRVAIVVFVVLATVFLFLKIKNVKARVLIAIGYILLAAVLGRSIFVGRFLDIGSYNESISLRNDLMKSAFQMFFSHPLIGIGLGNFLSQLPRFLSLKIPFSFLQPVHNIFFLVLAETGIVGLGLFLWLLAQAFHTSLKGISKKNDSLSLFAFLSLCVICFIGMTDHYFLTLQQGQLLFALVLGLCFSRPPKLLK